MGDPRGPAFDPTTLSSGGGRFIDHGAELDNRAKALDQLASLRAAFAGSAEQHWPALEAALTGAGGQIQQSAQNYAGLGQSMRTLADGVTTIDVNSGQNVASTGQDPR